MRSIPIVGFIILVSILTTIGNGSTETIVVDDDGGSWADYSDVQDAINNSGANDTVLIYEGEYFGGITLNESVSLIGNGTNKTTINADGDRYTVRIETSWCNLSKVKITGADYNMGSFGVLIVDDLDNITIDECIIIDNDKDGLYIKNGDNFTIRDSSIIDHMFTAMELRVCKNSRVINCTISDHRTAIELPGGSNLLVKDCYLESIGRGTIVSNVYNATFEDVTTYPNSSVKSLNIGITHSEFIKLVNCRGDGSYSIWGNEFDHYSNIEVENCTSQGNPFNFIAHDRDVILEAPRGQVAIFNSTNVSVLNATINNYSYALRIHYSDNVTIEASNLDDNDIYSLYIDESQHIRCLNISTSNNPSSTSNACGIKAENSDFIRIVNCSVRDNDFCGIRLTNCDHTEINRSIIKDNGDIGVQIRGSYYPWSCRDNNVVNSTIQGHDTGVIITASYGSFIISNNISSSDINGIDLSSTRYLRFIDNMITNCSGYGIDMWESENDVISRNHIYNCGLGINIRGGNFTLISNNSIFGSDSYGMALFGGVYDRPAREYLIKYNEFMDNRNHSIYINNARECVIHHNNFGKAQSAMDNGNTWSLTNSTWDDGEEGNYWADYNGTDGNEDGIGDTAHPIEGDANSTDRYPLMDPATTSAPEKVPGISPIGPMIALVALTILLRRRSGRK